MNEALATAIIPKAEEWREAMLAKVMHVMSEADAPDSVCDEQMPMIHTRCQDCSHLHSARIALLRDDTGGDSVKTYFGVSPACPPSSNAAGLAERRASDNQKFRCPAYALLGGNLGAISTA
jgi:hypothetical protein